MARKSTHLRTVAADVAADEAPLAVEPVKPLTLTEAVETGDYRKILLAQRREIAESIPDMQGPAKAALHRQLSLISKELAALEAKAKQEASEDGELTGDQPWDEEAI